jgi:hypothetical protein
LIDFFILERKIKELAVILGREWLQSLVLHSKG